MLLSFEVYVEVHGNGCRFHLFLSQGSPEPEPEKQLLQFRGNQYGVRTISNPSPHTLNLIFLRSQPQDL